MVPARVDWSNPCCVRRCWLRTALMALPVLVALLPFGAAQATLPDPPCGPYRVGVMHYPQVYEKVPGRPGEHRGLDKDFFTLLGERSGCRFDLQLESQPRVWARLRGGSLDLTSWALLTPERQTWAQFIPLLQSSPVVLSWRAHALQGEADLLARPALRAVVVRDASYGPRYDALLNELRKQGRVSEVADVETAARVFFAGRVDLLITYPWVVTGALREHGDAVQTNDWFPLDRGLSAGLAVSRRQVSAADQQRLLVALQDMQRDGSLERLLRQHLPAEGVTPLGRIELMP